MSYGPHTDAVEEVVRFVRDAHLLTGRGRLPEHVATTHDLREATDLAWNQTFGPDELTWTDIREHRLRPIRAAASGLDWYRSVSDSLVSLLEQFTVQIRSKLARAYSDLLDDIVGDLHNVAKARAVVGGRDRFFETLFAAYQAGTWPCGWRGEYPNGQLTVFSPSTHDQAV